MTMLMSTHSTMLRWRSMARWLTSAVRVAAGDERRAAARARSGRSAPPSPGPGTPARKNDARQLQCAAIGISTSGARKEPRMLLPKFCITPMLWPRRECSDSLATSDWHTGRNGPSARPMSRRAPNSATNEAASPDRKEHREKATDACEQDRLAPAGAVRQRTAEEGRQRPGEGERRGHESDLLVGEVQVLGDERHQVAGRVAVEEQEAEGDAEHPDQTLFVAHIVLQDPRLGQASTLPERPVPGLPSAATADCAVG